jgi:DNA-binding response OmpR family regulator
MRYSNNGMPVVFVIATDWKLRAAVRAELRERGIDALGMDSAEDAGRGLAGGAMPAVVVLEANAELAGDPAIQRLVARVPTVLVASRTETVALPRVAAVLYRPVRIGEIVEKVSELLARGQAA